MRHRTSDREFSAKARASAAKSGAAMPGGSFPIENEGDLKNAIRLAGRASDPAAARRHIKQRARALGLSKMIPEGFGDAARSWRDTIVTSAPLCFISDSVGETVSLQMYDAIELDDADERFKPVFTRDGYLKAMPRIARTGVQLYRGGECGRADMEVVRVYRPAEAVFATDAVASYTHMPMTLDHPPVPVTKDNWKKYATGETGEEVLRDGDSARVPMMLRDQAAIKAWKDGKNKLSVGYDCDLSWTPGITDAGEPYDCIQVPGTIRANHLAQVTAARGGPKLNIGDNRSTEGDHVMNMKTLTVDGFECSMTDQAAQIVQRTIKGLSDQLDAFEKKWKKKEEDDEDDEKEDMKKDAALKARDEAIVARDAEIATAKKTVETKDGEIAALKKQVEDAKAELTPAKIDMRVRDRLIIVQKGKGILGDQLVCDGKTDAEIRKAVVVAKIGDSAKDWTDEMVTGAFNTLAVTRRNEFERAGGNLQRDTIDEAILAFSGPLADGMSGRPGSGYGRQSQKDAAYADYDKGLVDAWKTPQPGQH